MPLSESLRIDIKDGVVELVASVVDPHRDEPETFLAALNERVSEHQYQAMTDWALLDPDDASIATCVECRDSIPEHLKDGMISMGFSPVETEGGGREQRSIFSRFQKRSRTKLDRWRTMYLRAVDISPRLREFEECCVEELQDGALSETAEEGCAVVINAARTCFRLLITPGLKGLESLEGAIQRERSAKRGRTVFHPAMVRGLSAFTGEALIAEHPQSSWSDDPDEESPLLVVTPGGAIVQTDPEFRVVRFVQKGNKELLTSYLGEVVGQSEHGE